MTGGGSQEGQVGLTMLLDDVERKALLNTAQ